MSHSSQADRALNAVGWSLPAALVAVAIASPSFGMTEYLGGGFLEIRSGCEEFGWSGTHQIMARMQPQGARGNPSDETQMAFYFSTGTIATRFNFNRGFRFSYVPTQATYVWNGPYSPEEPTMSFIFNIDGNFPTQNWPEMNRLFIDISNFNEHAGCNARMYLSLSRR